MTSEEELLLEQVVGAHRQRGADGAIRSHPAWHDLPAELRRDAYDETLRSRQLEAAIDPANQSTTVKAVLARLTRQS
jgi:hypothetical protein